jgi:hypothetical protein
MTSSARYVKDVATGAYKMVSTLPSDVWELLKSWVDANFDVGDNELVDSVTQDILLESQNLPLVLIL